MTARVSVQTAQGMGTPHSSPSCWQQENLGAICIAPHLSGQRGGKAKRFQGVRCPCMPSEHKGSEGIRAREKSCLTRWAQLPAPALGTAHPAARTAGSGRWAAEGAAHPLSSPGIHPQRGRSTVAAHRAAGPRAQSGRSPPAPAELRELRCSASAVSDRGLCGNGQLWESCPVEAQTCVQHTWMLPAFVFLLAGVVVFLVECSNTWLVPSARMEKQTECG